MKLLPTARRLAEDVRNGGKLGPRSTALLLELVEAMAAQIDAMQIEVRQLRKEKDKCG